MRPTPRLMMATLALPDERDYSSLKFEKLDWAIEPAPLKGLKLGLLLEAGCGVDAHGRSQGGGRARRAEFEAAGAHVEPLNPFLTQDMLDGLDRFLARPGAQRHRTIAR